MSSVIDSAIRASVFSVTMPTRGTSPRFISSTPAITVDATAPFTPTMATPIRFMANFLDGDARSEEHTSELQSPMYLFSPPAPLFRFASSARRRRSQSTRRLRSLLLWRPRSDSWRTFSMAMQDRKSTRLNSSHRCISSPPPPPSSALLPQRAAGDHSRRDGSVHSYYGDPDPIHGELSRWRC